MGISGSFQRGSVARAYIERLETALAAATLERDLSRERTRQATEGMSELRHRATRETAELERRFEERALAEKREAERQDAELERLRTAVREGERSVAAAEARLAKAEQRAEVFRTSLVALRAGRVYRLMRILWRLRRPFKRARPAAAPDPVPPPPRVAVKPLPVPSRKPGAPLRVASVLDEVSEAGFGPDCELIPLSLEDWHRQLDEQGADLLLVESAWNGSGGEWQHRIAQYPRQDLAGLPALRALVDGCRERGIPTVFWNKEDPVHFERFAEAASLFDHVFTTDERCLERYRDLPGERTVAALPFAAQPRIHNPIAAVPERSDAPCFAGAWYRDRHPDRRRALEALLDAARPHGLVIYDRCFGLDRDAVRFPERFQPYILGGLPYDRILDVYKSHRVFLNANSVFDSPTMCSRRVFELAACGTAILSTPSAALGRFFGEGVIAEAAEQEVATEALERLLGDPGERSRRVRAARRAVFARHTYAHRLGTIAEVAGVEGSPRQPPFAVPGESSNGAGDRHPWRLRLQPGVRLSESALADLAAAATFTEADVIGAPNGASSGEHRYANDLDPRALLLRRELVEERGGLSGTAEEVCVALREWSDDGVRFYAADADLVSSGDATPAATAAP